MTDVSNSEDKASEVTLVNIETLSSQELNALIVKLEEDINQLQSLLNALTIALERFQESKNALAELSKNEVDIQVPLTSLVYVPGQLANPGKVVVSVGTGYYIEMTLKNAEEYYERRLSSIEEQMCKLKNLLSTKNRQFNTVCSYMDQKFSLRNISSSIKT